MVQTIKQILKRQCHVNYFVKKKEKKHDQFFYTHLTLSSHRYCVLHLLFDVLPSFAQLD